MVFPLPSMLVTGNEVVSFSMNPFPLGQGFVPCAQHAADWQRRLLCNSPLLCQPVFPPGMLLTGSLSCRLSTRLRTNPQSDLHSPRSWHPPQCSWLVRQTAAMFQASRMPTTHSA